MTSPRRSPSLLLAALPAFFLAACAGDGGLLSTSSVAPEATAAMAPKPDSACVTLASQIENLRKEGTAGRLEAAAAGKSAMVPVLRASLVKQAELNKVNADFQARCSKVPMAPLSAQAPALPAAAAVAAAAPGATTAAAAKVASSASGVTSVSAATGAVKKAAATTAAAAKPAEKPAE